MNEEYSYEYVEEYDEDGNLIAEGVVEYSVESSEYIYEYDEDGNTTYEGYDYDGDGIADSEYMYEYDEDGNTTYEVVETGMRMVLLMRSIPTFTMRMAIF